MTMQHTRLNPLAKNIGSVSCATMRAEDLIPCFVSELESQHPLHRAHRKLVRDIKRRMDADDVAESCASADHESYYQSDESSYDLESLFDALGEYCLPYFYFGAHPGDGSDYGYWLSEDFQDSFESDGGLIVNDTADIPRAYTGEVLFVNDHGNMTLYSASRGRLREVWAIV
jgi:hypothetical protein